jgi:septal ring factor EnvC (AmiA/AmiB activator)
VAECQARLADLNLRGHQLQAQQEQFERLRANHKSECARLQRQLYDEQHQLARLEQRMAQAAQEYAQLAVEAGRWTQAAIQLHRRSGHR